MNYFSELVELFTDSYYFFVMIECLIISSCLSTLVFFFKKNDYIPVLLNVPILFFICYIRGLPYNLVILLISILVQALIMLLANKKPQGFK